MTGAVAGHGSGGRPRAGGSRGFTLIELMVSLVSSVVLVAALSSLMILAARAAPQGATREDMTLATVAGVDLLASDLAAATVIDLSAAPALRLSCADREGDGAPDVVVWSWSEEDGAPLTRSVNGGPARAVLPGAYRFVVAPQDTTVIVDGPSSLATSAETQLFIIDPASPTTQTASSSAHHAQTFTPTLPPEALSWSVTRAQARLRRIPTAGQLTDAIILDLRSSAGPGPPGATTFSSVQVPRLTLATGVPAPWVDLALTTPSMTPGTPVAFVARGLNAGEGGRVSVGAVTARAGVGYASSSSAGLTWNSSTTSALALAVYGTYTTRVANPVSTRAARAVRVELQAGPDERSRVVTTVRTPNLPVLP